MDTREKSPHRRVVDEPQPGFFRMRLVKRGPYVPAKIENVDGKWSATINGKPQLPTHEDPMLASGVLDIWHSAKIIDEAEYKYLIGLKEWAERVKPDHPAANPYKPIDLKTLPPVFTE